ncbi:MAG TPA: hypothetical protein P5307_16895 [Pirellulaceae bacterium]|nr:hypothetical protein [Planctomycetaceae bacterium]HRX80751.1 hypothetical protein [Pirellulaceae bacterium]
MRRTRNAESVMSQLLPHPDNGPPLHSHLSPEKRIEAWIELMKFGDVCFLAGLQHRLQPGQDALSAARESYARYTEAQDEKLLKMAHRFGDRHGR